ncbi:hypothetical protein [Pontibacter pudoricolor]|uniref:hypothetical protein n=1 Tax=Pontibacter pudoricolor TaxID=2694930 RepID=UPI001391C459|nr:hypothetical protein [Pontibacter pudoricolor]
MTKKEKAKGDILFVIVYEAFSALAKEHGCDRKVIDQAFQRMITVDLIIGLHINHQESGTTLEH